MAKLDFVKQYIVQCISNAANNLRLSSEKIETVALLRERLASSNNLEEEIKNFKRITELSKLGIKLGEILNYLENSRIDFLKLSDKFKEHSFYLVKEINYFLDIVTPQTMRNILDRLDNKTINVDLTKLENKKVEFNDNKAINIPQRTRADELKEAIIFDELSKLNEFSFEKFEERILRPIKDLDSFLNKVSKYDYTESEINSYIKLMNENAELSQKVGFEIISNMHKIFAQGLEAIHQKKIAPSNLVIEALRACLIVIVAVVRGKEVDITNYLNRAENFGKMIFQTKRVF
ncbi:hypothetical protein [Rosettibacter firmus]|uniref:hypothetical protein n=1 Tax=Rosettibacter firmus TaxID=3111522 RepID=UPI00336C126D